MFVCVGVLLVVSVGVALGVFVGGVLLVAAARYFKRFNSDPFFTRHSQAHCVAMEVVK